MKHDTKWLFTNQTKICGKFFVNTPEAAFFCLISFFAFFNIISPARIRENSYNNKGIEVGKQHMNRVGCGKLHMMKVFVLTAASGTIRVSFTFFAVNGYIVLIISEPK